MKIELENCQKSLTLKDFEEIVQVEELYSVYDRMSPSRKKMVDARIISDKEYVNQWSAKIYSGKDFAEGQAEIYTEKKKESDQSQKRSLQICCTIKISHTSMNVL